MKRQQLYTLGAVLLAAAALGACAGVSPQTQGTVDTAATVACVGMEAADGAFNVCATSPQFPKHDFCAANVKAESIVYAGIKSACTPPYTVDTVTLIRKAGDAANAILALAGKPQAPAP